MRKVFFCLFLPSINELLDVFVAKAKYSVREPEQIHCEWWNGEDTERQRYQKGTM